MYKKYTYNTFLYNGEYKTKQKTQKINYKIQTFF